MPRKLHPLPDFLVDYTWRNYGRTIIRCPVCHYRGLLREDDGKPIIIHKEIISDFPEHCCLLEFCRPDEQEVQRKLLQKEKDRLSALEYNRNRKRDD